MRRYIFFSTYIFAIAIFLTHFFIVKTVVYGDGRYYFSYLPAIFTYHTFHTAINPNPFSIGPALFWSIPYLLSRNEMLIGIWNISFVFIGLVLLYKSLIKFFQPSISFLTVIAVFLATNLFFYGSIDVINSHSASFFFSCVFVYLWLHKQTVKRSFLLGLTLGMLTLIRTQDVVFIILPLACTLQNVIASKAKRSLYILFFTLLGTLFFLLPQFFLWHYLYGSFIKSPYLYDPHHTFNFLRPQFFGVLFNPTNGYILYTPLAIIATIGFVYFWGKSKSLAISILLAVVAELYIISSWSIWWEGASYSARMMVSSLPLLAFGIATLFQKEGIKRATFLTILFTGANMLLIFVFLLKK